MCDKNGMGFGKKYYFWLFAYEWWGRLQPESKIDPKGRKWKSLFWGVWVRQFGGC